MLTHFGKTPQHKISGKSNLWFSICHMQTEDWTHKYEKDNTGIFAGFQCKRAKKNKYSSTELLF
jgi:hypothetical protein